MVDKVRQAPAWSIHPVVVTLPALLASLPFVLGLGIDLPDDALYSSLSTWEWLSSTIRDGVNPFWIPGRLGGQSLFAEAQQMAPFYPAALTLLVLPPGLAWTLSCAAHAVLAAITTATLARVLGLSPRGQALAAWGVTLGTLGTTAHIEAQTDTWPVIAWFPAVLAAWERLLLAETPRMRLRAAGVGSVALALLLLGAHLRHGIGACAALALWVLLRSPRALPWLGALAAPAILLSAPSWLPGALEWREAVGPGAMMPALAVPPEQRFHWTALGSLLAPRVFVTSREFGVGTALILGLLFADRSRPWTRAYLVGAGALCLAAADPRLPGGWPILLPWTWAAHPVTILYAGLAMVPLSVLAAAGLEAATMGAPVRRGGVLLLVACALAAAARLAWGSSYFPSRYQWDHGLLSLVQAGVVLGLASVLLRTSAWRLVALADLAVFGVHAHLAVRSEPLPILTRDRIEAPELAQGSADWDELRDLDADGLHWVRHLQTGLQPVDDVGGEAVRVEEEGPELQARLLQRRWPVHLAVARGTPSLSGRAKLPAAREVEWLTPLLRAMASVPPDPRSPGSQPWKGWFGGPNALGSRTLLRHGMRYLLTDDGPLDLGVPAPPCRLETAWRVERDGERRVALLLSGAEGPALLESERPIQASGPGTVVRCPGGPLDVELVGPGPALITVALRHHPGWRAWVDGVAAEPFPVDQVRLGVELPAGARRLHFRFEPPGLRAASGLALLGGLVLVVILRKERHA